MQKIPGVKTPLLSILYYVVLANYVRSYKFIVMMKILKFSGDVIVGSIVQSEGSDLVKQYELALWKKLQNNGRLNSYIYPYYSMNSYAYDIGGMTLE